VRSLVLSVAVMACHSRDVPPDPQPLPSPPVGSPAPTGSSPTWTGEPIASRTVTPEPTTFSLGNDLIVAHPTPQGWLGLKLRDVGSDFTSDIVDSRGVIASDKSASLLASDDAMYVVFDTGDDKPPHMARLANRKLVPMTGDFALRWAFGHVGIANDTRAGLATQHWQTIAIDHDKLSVVETSKGPYATGAARLGAEIIVAVREHDPKGDTMDKARALIAAQNGDATNLGRIIGQPRGWLLHVDNNGHVTSREVFAEQTPGQVAATKSGWLVIVTEGTAGHGFKDGVMLGRAPGSPSLHVLARDLELGSGLIAAGDWACFYTMPGESRVVHCVDPVRRIHVTSPTLPDNVNLYGIETAPTSRLLLHHSWYRDGYAKPAVDDTLALALP
jgi:hypothetical protein